MKTKKKHKGTLVCRDCGGSNVQCLDWVDANTNEIIGGVEPSNDETWCEDCETHPGLTTWAGFQKEKEEKKRVLR